MSPFFVLSAFSPPHPDRRPIGATRAIPFRPLLVPSVPEAVRDKIQRKTNKPLENVCPSKESNDRYQSVLPGRLNPKPSRSSQRRHDRKCDYDQRIRNRPSCRTNRCSVHQPPPPSGMSWPVPIMRVRSMGTSGWRMIGANSSVTIIGILTGARPSPQPTIGTCRVTNPGVDVVPTYTPAPPGA